MKHYKIYLNISAIFRSKSSASFRAIFVISSFFAITTIPIISCQSKVSNFSKSTLWIEIQKQHNNKKNNLNNTKQIKYNNNSIMILGKNAKSISLFNTNSKKTLLLGKQNSQPNAILYKDSYQNNKINNNKTKISQQQIKNYPFRLIRDFTAKQYIGKLHIVNIGFPKTLLNHNRIKTNLITKQLVQNILPQRPKNSHKGTFGQLLVIGGSKTYKGAPILSAIAGLKSGCGLVSLASIPTVCNAFTNQFPEGISIELKENNNGSINFNNKNLITTLINKYNTIIFGPGISTDPDCLKILKHILENYNGTTIIDADGLNLLANNINLLNKTNTKTILTPHIKEMARLLKQNNSPIKNKLQTLENFAKNYNTTVILKSAVTTIFTPDGSSFFNTTGNHGMASAGSGDVLAGIIGSFVAQGLNTTNSSILATYLHGLAGDIAQNYENPFSITASSIIKYIHKAFSNLEENLHHHQHKLH